MKTSLKTIIMIVCVAMLGVFVYQIYWLYGLYQTTSQQFDKTVYEAMDIADQYEVVIRSELLSLDSTYADKDIAMNVGMTEDTAGQQVYYSYDKSETDTVNQSINTSDNFNSYNENVNSTENLAAYIKKTMHYVNDQMMPIDIDRFDSLLNVELLKYDIHQPHQVYVISTDNDSIIQSADRNRKFDLALAKQYDFLYDYNGGHAYRLYIKNPNRQLLGQMAGLFLTSVVILTFLVFTFVYLLKIIRRMQTEEELKTNFTNNMTHELKTPIAVSYAAIDALMIADKPIVPERQEKYLNIAKDQMHHLSGQVEQILNMSRKDNKHIELKIETVNLEDLINNLVDKLHLIARKQVKFEMNLDVKTIRADCLHLTNILNNLMENGIKYSYDDVRVLVSTKMQDNQVVISVEDNGIGIDDKYLSKVFDKFYRVPTGNRHNVKGFGLGLFYVKEMTEKHGGTIKVKSRLGQGSVFTIKLPQ